MKQLFILVSVCFSMNTNAQVCFNTSVNYATSTSPYSITSADFNGDGIVDLAEANAGANNVSILLGNGNGSFGTATNFAAGTTPSSVISKDFNADGIIDLVVANAGSNNVSVLLGTGTGSFGAATNFAAGSVPFSVISGDFNGDGKADLAVANNSANVSILLGTGIGSFGAATNFAAGTVPSSVTSADFNGDGKADLAVSNQGSNNVSILLGTGTGSFGAATNFAVSNYPCSITSVDFNGDGIVDLATANNNTANVSVIMGSGTGSFGTATNFGVGISPFSITSADFNGDGKADLATANYNAATVSVLLGTGTGSFSTATGFAAGASPRSITSADFNGDGKVDLAVANYSSDNLSVLLNCTTFCSGDFGAASNFSVGTNPYEVTSEDFNGDGIVDLALANNSSNNISVLLGTGSGSFGAAASYATGSSPYSITSRDFNGDGKPDLAVANNNSSNVSVLLGSGTGSFGAASNFTVGTNPRSVKSADFNGDGKADLAVVNKNTNDVSVLLGTGTGSFGAAASFAAGSEPVSITCADFNGDGKVDLATGAMLGSNNLSVLLGTGTGSFGTASGFAAGPNPFMITNSDFNKDGKIDLAVANAGTSYISVLLGTGNGSFTAAVNFPAGTDPYSVTFADFNWDGKTDLAVANSNSNNVSVLFGTGTGSFGAPANFATGTNPASVIGADFNRDGKTDLAVANFGSNNVSILLFNTPSAPTGTAAQPFCSGASPTIGDLTAIGTSIQWYAAPSGGTALSVGTALANNTHYYASQTISSCGGESSARFDVTATINTTPGAPTGIPAQSFCSGALPTVANLVATGTNIQWYALSSGGSALASTTALATATDYFATATVNGCESTTRFGVTATVNTTPTAPTGTASQSFCSGAAPTVADLAATGTSVQWYALSSGGSALASTTALVTATDYYASQTVNGCESSLRFDVTATVNTTPGAPTGIAAQSFCSGASPTVADLAAIGTSVQWYALSSGGAALASTTALVTATHYYASQTVNGCESSLRFDVTATINATPVAPTGTAAQSFCSGASPTVADLAATGTSIQWYALSSGGAALASTTALVTATDYFASETVNGCESTTRFGVTVTVNTTPGAPTGTAAQSFCSGTSPTVADLTATATSVQWYALSSGGSALATTTLLVTATDYFATETVNGCESITRFGVTTTVNTTPGVPTGTAAQTFCSGVSPTVADLAATGSSVQWYALSSGGSALASTIALVTATDYYASQTVSGCESSLRFGVTATINTTPGAPTGTAGQTFCSGTSPTVADLTATGTSVQWYALSSGGSALASTTALLTATDYFATETVNGCESITRFGVTTTVNTTPGVPTGTAAQSFCSGSSPTVADLAATGTSVQWYAASVGGSPLATTLALVTATDYFAAATVNGCESTTRFAVTVTVGVSPDVTTLLSGLTLTANQNGAAYQWINCDNANAPLFGQFNQSFTATAYGNYAVSITTNGCTDTSSCYNVNNVGIIENTSAETITIYPNPFTSKSTIAFTQEQSNCTIKIIDVLGKEIEALNFTGRELIIEREEMLAGIYFVQIVDRNKNVINKKIIIE